jgi:hypothetical protein
MFADVAGSTAMYENMGDDLARERISKALKTLISVTRRHNGKLVKTIGDEILVYFSDVDMAVYAAKAIQETMEDDRSPETIGVSIRIGMQYGSAILESDDIFGDTVNVAARVASMAKARQILCTQEIAFMVNNPELSNNMRPYDRLRVKGRNEHLDVYLFGWEQEGDITAMATASSFTNPARYEQAKKLTLKYAGQSHDINGGQGRPDFALPFEDRTSSRQIHHYRSEHQWDVYPYLGGAGYLPASRGIHPVRFRLHQSR